VCLRWGIYVSSLSLSLQCRTGGGCARSGVPGFLWERKNVRWVECQQNVWPSACLWLVIMVLPCGWRVYSEVRAVLCVFSSHLRYIWCEGTASMRQCSVCVGRLTWHSSYNPPNLYYTVSIYTQLLSYHIALEYVLKSQSLCTLPGCDVCSLTLRLFLGNCSALILEKRACVGWWVVWPLWRPGCVGCYGW